MAQKSQKLTTSQLIISVIGLLFLFVFGHIIPTWSTVTREGVKILCTFIGILVLISGLNKLTWPALMGGASLVLYGLCDANTLFANMLGTSTVFQIVFCWILAGALRESGATDVLSNWLLTRKFFQGNGLVLISALLVIFYFTGAVTSPTAGILLAFSIWETMRDKIGIEKGGKFDGLMLIVLFLMANSGSSLIPFKGMVPASIKMFEGISGMDVTDGGYFISHLVQHTVYIVACIVMLYIMCKDDIKRLNSFDISSVEGIDAGNTRFNKTQIIIIVGFAVGLMYSIVLNFIPKGAFYDWFNSITQALWFVIVAVVLSWIRVEGKPVVNLDVALKKYTMWGILLIASVMMYVGTQLSADAMGIKAWLLEVLLPLFGGMPLIVFLLIVCAGSIILTNFFSNFATMVIFFTLSGPLLAMYEGLDFSAFYVMISAASNKAYLTYAACGVSPLLVSKESLSTKKLFTYGTIPGILFIITGTLTAFVLCNIM